MSVIIFKNADGKVMVKEEGGGRSTSYRIKISR